MKEYIEKSDHSTYQCGGIFLPSDPMNRHYAQMQREIANGEAEIIPYVAPPPEPVTISIEDVKHVLLRDSEFREQCQKCAEARINQAP